MGLIRNLRMGRETLRIIRTGEYCAAGEHITLPAVDFTAVEVVSPDLECRALSRPRRDGARPSRVSKAYGLM